MSTQQAAVRSASNTHVLSEQEACNHSKSSCESQLIPRKPTYVLVVTQAGEHMTQHVGDFEAPHPTSRRLWSRMQPGPQKHQRSGCRVSLRYTKATTAAPAAARPQGRAALSEGRDTGTDRVDATGAHGSTQDHATAAAGAQQNFMRVATHPCAKISSASHAGHAHMQCSHAV